MVRAFRPDVVLSTGGYVAIPVGLAGRAVEAPLLVHEQTTRLGPANRLLLRQAPRGIVMRSPCVGRGRVGRTVRDDGED